MAKRIPQSDIDEVLSRVSIVDVISDYVALKSSGNGEFKGLCPFHSEKSPSFGVSATKNLWHCFGCGEGGNLFQFLNKIDSLNFVEAVEKLAARVGYTLNYEEGGSTNVDGQIRSRVLAANAAAAEFFSQAIDSAEAEPGRAFLQSRGFDKEASRRFSVGWAPKGWSSLTEHLHNLGFKDEELLSAALVSKKDGSSNVYDRFRGRLIWPIRDTTNAVIGFGARKIFDDDQGPKYLNTSETPVYHKSQVLYGLDLAKRDISKQQQAVVVEGYTDVMACHLAGITTAIATCGTAFGDDHIRVLNRLLVGDKEKPAEVIFNFDPDEAGQKAAMRAFASAQKFNALSFIAVGPEGLDPCDLRNTRGNSAIVEMIGARRPLIEFAIERSIKSFDLQTREGQVAALRATAPIVAEIQDVVLRASYEKLLSEITLVDRNDVNQVVTTLVRGAKREAVSRQTKDSPQSIPETAQLQLPPFDIKDPVTRKERFLLELVAQHRELFDLKTIQRVFRVFFAHPRHAAISKAVLLEWNSQDFIAEVEQRLPEQLRGNWREVLLSKLPIADVAQLNEYAAGVLAGALTSTIEFEKRFLIQALGQAQAASRTAEIEQISQKLIDLDRELMLQRAKR